MGSLNNDLLSTNFILRDKSIEIVRSDVVIRVQTCSFIYDNEFLIIVVISSI